jgi:hypothetical protein
MKKIIKLTESDLVKIVTKVLKEQSEPKKEVPQTNKKKELKNMSKPTDRGRGGMTDITAASSVPEDTSPEGLLLDGKVGSGTFNQIEVVPSMEGIPSLDEKELGLFTDISQEVIKKGKERGVDLSGDIYLLKRRGDNVRVGKIQFPIDKTVLVNYKGKLKKYTQFYKTKFGKLPPFKNW